MRVARRDADAPRAEADSLGVVWEPLTMEGAERARTAVQQLARSSGPVFANVGAGDLASYVYVELAKPYKRPVRYRGSEGRRRTRDLLRPPHANRQALT